MFFAFLLAFSFLSTSPNYAADIKKFVFSLESGRFSKHEEDQAQDTDYHVQKLNEIAAQEPDFNYSFDAGLHIEIPGNMETKDYQHLFSLIKKNIGLALKGKVKVVFGIKRGRFFVPYRINRDPEANPEISRRYARALNVLAQEDPLFQGNLNPINLMLFVESDDSYIMGTYLQIKDLCLEDQQETHGICVLF